MEWKFFFTDGTTFSGDPWEVPDKGVAIVLQRDGRFSRRKLFLNEYYIWRPSLDRWTEHPDAASLIVALIHEPWSVVRRGEYMRETDFEKILIAADNDPDFPVKAAGPPHPAWRR